ncbi:MAG: 3-deoxy-7-phosphoheptulonate synthase, partial [Lachnospiraceae bacterium]|nr:3-deoxy-7-phosphoheptulonate synthase [Lachnospiraceae bacterium]
MSFQFIKHLPTPAEIKEQFPLPMKLAELKEKRDIEIKKVFSGESGKFLLIIGPCSADNEDAVCDYVSRLAKVSEKVSDKIIIIPRIYTNKPRTTG